MFKLSIHADIPEDATNPLGYSHPGEELWQDVFSPGDPRVKTRLYANNLSEQFYDPNMDEIIGFDTEAYQYNFFLDPLDPNIFHQEEGTIYWLDVQAWVDPGNSDNQAVFGWKSTRNVWNDDAVFGDNTIFGQSDPPNALFWQEMYHPLIPDESLNLAFVITPEPATISLLVIGGIGVLARRRKR